ncbi:MAG: metabolite traffic protein EboE [Candidatus Methylacidiphilales bacterium]
MIVGYCLNVHPGEGWNDLRQAVETFAVPIGTRWRGKCPYGLGLRLSGRTVAELERLDAVEEADRFFARQPVRPFTVNAFPHGAFHGQRVKEQVYAPDWSDPERLRYTLGAARLLAGWLREGEIGSISSVPLGFREALGHPDFLEAASTQLLAWVEFAVQLEASTGRQLVLALEPEPGCALETTAELLVFLERWVWVRCQDETLARRHLGICLDLCHAAVQFEDLGESLRQCQAAGVAVAKVQVSNALAIRNDAESRHVLARFIEPVYLHQVSLRRSGGEIRRWLDLDQAVADLADEEAGSEVRVHFHVPLTFIGNGPLQPTLGATEDEVWKQLNKGISTHLEVETYTFAVLPEGVRPGGLSEMLMGEMDWLENRLDMAGSPLMERSGASNPEGS